MLKQWHFERKFKRRISKRILFKHHIKKNFIKTVIFNQTTTSFEIIFERMTHEVEKNIFKIVNLPGNKGLGFYLTLRNFVSNNSWIRSDFLNFQLTITLTRPDIWNLNLKIIFRSVKNVAKSPSLKIQNLFSSLKSTYWWKMTIDYLCVGFWLTIRGNGI